MTRASAGSPLHGMVSSGSVPKRWRVKAWFLVVVVVFISVVGSVSFLGWRRSVPGVVSHPAPPRFVGHKTSLVFTLEATRGNVARVEIRVAQTGSSAVVVTREGALGQRLDIPVVLESATLGVREGGASLEVWARDDFWRPFRLKERAIATYPVTVDLTPARIEVLGATRYVAAGGSGLVAFRVTGASRATVSAGKLVEPSFPWGPPERGARVALVALPWDLAPGASLAITAEDEAGNVASRALPSELRSRRFPRDRIEIKDAFLQAKVPELLPQRSPSQRLVDGFLVINRELRRQAEETKRRIGASSAETPLWEGPLVQPSRTKVFANFAEMRTYLYGGREIDKQVHYGYDLASTRQSSVPAANRGGGGHGGGRRRGTETGGAPTPRRGRGASPPAAPRRAPGSRSRRASRSARAPRGRRAGGRPRRRPSRRRRRRPAPPVRRRSSPAAPSHAPASDPPSPAACDSGRTSGSGGARWRRRRAWTRRSRRREPGASETTPRRAHRSGPRRCRWRPAPGPSRRGRRRAS